MDLKTQMHSVSSMVICISQPFTHIQDSKTVLRTLATHYVATATQLLFFLARATRGLKVGESKAVSKLNFGTGKNEFMARNEGDIFVTELGEGATKGQLNQIGVFGDKQNYVIQFSEETAFNQGVRVLGQNASRSIFTIPGGSSLQGTFIIRRVQ